ncbi:GyrI-like domain-containing protein [Phytoactinopolyspora limicola]|uniref:GyrI-like domain-containing protein n=1 Tax=Phytoactinopolyspora limicola TaxID=2715536 RepID=UPI00140B2BC7|nr:GyrI-like domain-containing protein [Phytoactinopolyspora limicola]
MADTLTDAELTILGLVAEHPRHGYELEAVIEARGIREWTALGFSSIYYVLNRLASRGLVSSQSPAGGGKGRRTYAVTTAGADRLAAATRAALAELRPAHPSVLVGLANSPALPTPEVVAALRERRARLSEQLTTVLTARATQEMVPPFVAAIFHYSQAHMETELAWLDTTIRTLEGTMDKFDVKKDRKDLYAPHARDFQLVEVPEMAFLMVDGDGDPNTSELYREAVEALYAVAYTLKFASKNQLGRDYVVAPLEGLWWAEDYAVFKSRDKNKWQWTMMINQPEWITQSMVDDAIQTTASKKDLPALGRLRFERYTEGPAAQIMHIGPYDDEAATLQRLHDDYLPANGLTLRGRHHEIYLGDPRKTEPAKLKTILRQPVARL